MLYSIVVDLTFCPFLKNKDPLIRGFLVKYLTPY